MTTENAETAKKPFFSKKVADQLAQQLRAGEAPTQRDGVQNIPYNPANGRAYHGINALNLMMQGNRDPRWMSFDDAKNAGYKVKAEEKGTPVQYWLPKRPGEEKRKMQTAYLFNADQLQFIPPLPKKPIRPDPYERVADILANSGVTVVHDQKERAFYNPAKDEIHLPKPDSYKNIDNYCQDALNAYFHSTGHPARLDRETFDSPKRYQQNAEELVCAVSTMMMCAELGIPGDPTKNPELATKWADNMEEYPIQFSQGIKMADDAVWRTMRQEQMRNIELNPENNQVWRPVAEASPAIAVKTLLAQREVLELADKEPGKVNAFKHDGKDVFTKPGTGYILSKSETPSPEQGGVDVNMKVKTEGYDHVGNTYDVVMEATVRKNENGLTETLKQPEATEINLSSKNMALPLDWNGKIEVTPCHEDEYGNTVKGRSDDFPDHFYGAFAEGQGKDVLLASFDREKQAEYYASLVERQFLYQQERPQQRQEQTQAQERTPQQPEATEEQKAQQEYDAEVKAQEPEPDKEQLRQEAKEKVAERLTEEKQDADKAANRVKAMIAKTFTIPKEPTPYMQTKGVKIIKGTYQNKASTCIPLYNVNGELRSMAYADKDGKKNFAKGTERDGCAFYDKKAVEKADVVGFAVGVATAATVSQTFKGVPVVATMDAANLPVVAAAFKEKYPDKQQVIFADRKIMNENDSGKNPIPYHAFKAAKETGALVVQPRFASDEQDKHFMDFNDLATKSKYGKDAVREQCESALDKAKEMASELAREQGQGKSRSGKENTR